MASFPWCDGHDAKANVLFWNCASAVGQCGESLREEGVNRVMFDVEYWV